MRKACREQNLEREINVSPLQSMRKHLKLMSSLHAKIHVRFSLESMDTAYGKQKLGREIQNNPFQSMRKLLKIKSFHVKTHLHRVADNDCIISHGICEGRYMHKRKSIFQPRASELIQRAIYERLSSSCSWNLCLK